MRTVPFAILAAVLWAAPCLSQTGEEDRFILEDDGQWQTTDNVHRLAQFPKVHRPGDVPGRMALAPDWAGNFGDMLINEVIPDMDATYRTIADRDHRAMAGLSLGGMLTNRVGMENLDHFAWIGIFSGGVVGDPATAHGGVMADAEAFNERVHLIFQCSGSEEGPERVLDNQEQLEAAGINAVAYISPGTAHDWMTWRRSLYQFAPLLFKP